MKRVLPDVQASGMGTAYALGKLTKDGDEENHRSIAAYPVIMPGWQKPWGAVVSTSNQVGHFGLAVDGLEPEIVIEDISKIVALAVSISALTSAASNAGAAAPAERPSPETVGSVEESTAVQQ